jgi:hypothetical protein
MKTALLLVGSPFGFRSASGSLGSYLMDRLTEKGFTTNKIHIHKSVKSQAGVEEILHLVGISDLVVLTLSIVKKPQTQCDRSSSPYQIVGSLKQIRT